MFKSAGALFAIAVLMATSAGAAEPGTADVKPGATSGATTPATMPAATDKAGPDASVVVDVEQGKQVRVRLKDKRTGQPLQTVEDGAAGHEEALGGRGGHDRQP